MGCFKVAKPKIFIHQLLLILSIFNCRSLSITSLLLSFYNYSHVNYWPHNLKELWIDLNFRTNILFWFEVRKLDSTFFLSTLMLRIKYGRICMPIYISHPIYQHNKSKLRSPKYLWVYTQHKLRSTWTTTPAFQKLRGNLSWSIPHHDQWWATTTTLMLTVSSTRRLFMRRMWLEDPATTTCITTTLRLMRESRWWSMNKFLRGALSMKRKLLMTTIVTTLQGIEIGQMEEHL